MLYNNSSVPKVQPRAQVISPGPVSKRIVSVSSSRKQTPALAPRGKISKKIQILEDGCALHSTRRQQ